MPTERIRCHNSGQVACVHTPLSSATSCWYQCKVYEVNDKPFDASCIGHVQEPWGLSVVGQGPKSGKQDPPCASLVLRELYQLNTCVKNSNAKSVH